MAHYSFSKLLNGICSTFLGTQVTIAVSSIVLVVSLILTVCYGCKKLRKKNIKLPKSLVSLPFVSVSDFSSPTG